jgi:GT2 family glycosyltransferase
MPELSVVVPTYRRHSVLNQAMAALARQTVDLESFEVIVVDDPVEDDSDRVAAALESHRIPVRHLHRADRGVSAARNVGWRAARAPVVLFLGDDILSSPTLVAEHLAFHARHAQEHVAVLGHVRWADRLRVTPFMTWLERGFQSNYGRLDRGGIPSWFDFLTTNVSVKRSMLERAGGFDERNFPFLSEDTDLGLRLFGLGLELRYQPAARAEHLHRQTLAQWRTRIREIARSERRMIELYPELEPHFERRLRLALAESPARARAARLLFPLRRAGWPRLSRFVDHHLDVYYRQRLAPAFLEVWDSASSA